MYELTLKSASHVNITRQHCVIDSKIKLIENYNNEGHFSFN